MKFWCYGAQALTHATLIIALGVPVQAQTVAGSAAGLPPVVFCLDDGMKIGAERFEQRDGKFYLYVPGAAAPLEYPASRVRGLNVADCGPVQAKAATVTDFGIHGSNTIGERLMPLLIGAYGQRQYGVQPVFNPTKSEEQEITIRDATGSKAVIDFQSHGSGTSAKGLLEGKAVIGMSSRQMKPDEAKAITAKHKLDPLAPGNEAVLALDGLAVIVNPANPVRELSLEEIAKIFAGQITRWSEVGGPDVVIKAHRRDDKSGTYDTFKALVLDPAKLPVAPLIVQHESSENVSASVAADKDAIGFIGLPYLNQNRPVMIKAACGVSEQATHFAIKAESYPLARRLYVYTIGTPSHPEARQLKDFVLSDAAQATIMDAGFVDQSIDVMDPGQQTAWTESMANNASKLLGSGKPVPASNARSFADILRQVQRTSVAFRFDKLSSKLDVRAEQDLARLTGYLKSPAAAGRPVFLAGFADADGPWQDNAGLAMNRATKVRAALKSKGIEIPNSNVLSFSYMAPVACNDTDAGKAKNRRVEVWLGK